MARIVFMGSPAFAVPALDALARVHEIAAVYCKPPAKQGRNMREKKCAVHEAAQRLSLLVETPAKMDSKAAENLRAHAPDFLVVVAYGMLLTREIIDIPRKAAINAHASLLPRWRGAAPIHRAIETGDSETGITTMLMEEKLDSGKMLLRETTPIHPDDTAGTLHERLAKSAADILCKTLADFDSITPETQDENAATWAKKISPHEAEIDFTDSAESLARKIRAFAPRPGAWFMAHDKRIKIHEAEIIREHKSADAGEYLNPDDKSPPIIACGENAIRLLRLQPEGKSVMDGGAFSLGYRLPARITRKD